MLLEIVSQLVDRLNKIRVKVGKSVASEARTVARNQAFIDLFALKETIYPQVKLSSIRDILQSLNKPVHPKISPFNPKEGFYLINFERIDKGLKVYLRGQNLYFSTFCFLQFLLREVYDAYVTPANEHFYLYCGRTIVGIGKLHEKENCIKIKVGEFLPYGKFKKHEQILVKFWQKNFLITNLIFCPSYVVEKLMPKIKEKKEEYSTLLITHTKILMKTLKRELALS